MSVKMNEPKKILEEAINDVLQWEHLLDGDVDEILKRLDAHGLAIGPKFSIEAVAREAAMKLAMDSAHIPLIQKEIVDSFECQLNQQQEQNKNESNEGHIGKESGG